MNIAPAAQSIDNNHPLAPAQPFAAGDPRIADVGQQALAQTQQVSTTQQVYDKIKNCNLGFGPDIGHFEEALKMTAKLSFDQQMTLVPKLLQIFKTDLNSLPPFKSCPTLNQNWLHSTFRLFFLIIDASNLAGTTNSNIFHQPLSIERASVLEPIPTVQTEILAMKEEVIKNSLLYCIQNFELMVDTFGSDEKRIEGDLRPAVMLLKHVWLQMKKHFDESRLAVVDQIDQHFTELMTKMQGYQAPDPDEKQFELVFTILGLNVSQVNSLDPLLRLNYLKKMIRMMFRGDDYAILKGVHAFRTNLLLKFVLEELRDHAESFSEIDLPRADYFYYCALRDNSDFLLKNGKSHLSRKKVQALKDFRENKKRRLASLGNFAKYEEKHTEAALIAQKFTTLLSHLKPIVEVLGELERCFALSRISEDNMTKVIIAAAVSKEISPEQPTIDPLATFDADTRSRLLREFHILRPLISKEVMLLAVNQYLEGHRDVQVTILYRVLLDLQLPTQSVELRRDHRDVKKPPLTVSSNQLQTSAELLQTVRATKEWVQSKNRLQRAGVSQNAVFPLQDRQENGVKAYFKTNIVEDKSLMHSPYIELLNWDLAVLLDVTRHFTPTSTTRLCLKNEDGSNFLLRGSIQQAQRGQLFSSYLKMPPAQRPPINKAEMLDFLLTTLIWGTFDCHGGNVIGVHKDAFRPVLFDNGRTWPHNNKALSWGRNLISPYRNALLFLPICYEALTAADIAPLKDRLTNTFLELHRVQEFFGYSIPRKRLQELPKGWFAPMQVLHACEDRLLNGITALEEGQAVTVRDLIFKMFPLFKFFALLSLFTDDSVNEEQTPLLLRLLKDKSPEKYEKYEPLLMANVGSFTIERAIHNCASGAKASHDGPYLLKTFDPGAIYAMSKLDLPFPELIKKVEQSYLVSEQMINSLADEVELHLYIKAYEQIADRLILKIFADSEIDLKEVGGEYVQESIVDHIETQCKVHNIPFISTSNQDLMKIQAYGNGAKSRIVIAKYGAYDNPTLYLTSFNPQEGVKEAIKLDYMSYPGKLVIPPKDVVLSIGELNKHYSVDED